MTKQILAFLFCFIRELNPYSPLGAQCTDVCVWAWVCGRRIWGACRVESRPQRRFSLSLSHIRQRASTRVCDTYTDTQAHGHAGHSFTYTYLSSFPLRASELHCRCLGDRFRCLGWLSLHMALTYSAHWTCQSILCEWFGCLWQRKENINWNVSRPIKIP